MKMNLHPCSLEPQADERVQSLSQLGEGNHKEEVWRVLGISVIYSGNESDRYNPKTF